MNIAEYSARIAELQMDITEALQAEERAEANLRTAERTYDAAVETRRLSELSYRDFKRDNPDPSKSTEKLREELAAARREIERLKRERSLPEERLERIRSLPEVWRSAIPRDET